MSSMDISLADQSHITMPLGPSRVGLLALAAFLGAIALTPAAVSALTHPLVSCERHQGAFSDRFSTEFDIDRVDCGASWVEGSPTIYFWSVPPYVGIS
jgi:hypothetical protein